MSSRVFREEEVLELAKAAYEGNADFPIIKDRCALLVIDMQDEFVKPHYTPYWTPESTRQVPKIKAIIKHCRQVNIPVIYTAFGHTHARLDRRICWERSGRCFCPDRALLGRGRLDHHMVKG